MCGPQIRLCFFTFRPIALKQLTSLTKIDTFIWLGGPVVTHPTGAPEPEIPGSVPGSGKDFMSDFLFVLCFYFFVQNTLFVPMCCSSSLLC